MAQHSFFLVFIFEHMDDFSYEIIIKLDVTTI